MSYDAHARIDSLEARLAELEKLVGEKILDARAPVVAGGAPDSPQPRTQADAVQAVGVTRLAPCAGQCGSVATIRAKYRVLERGTSWLVNLYCAGCINRLLTQREMTAAPVGWDLEAL